MGEYSNCMNPYIQVRLEIIGNEEEVNEVKNFLKNEPNENGQNLLIDFNHIIKKPEDMSIFINNPQLEDQLWDISSDGVEGTSEVCENYHTVIGGMMMFDGAYYNNCNLEERWYLQNWGCIGNPEDQEMGNENTYEFTLVHGGAFQILKKLSSMFPKIMLVASMYRRSMEDGLFIFKKGKLKRSYNYEELYYNWNDYNKPLLPSSNLEKEIWNHIAKIRSIVSDLNKTL
jgi:hypothetical protein